jgi:hypothetical protein
MPIYSGLVMTITMTTEVILLMRGYFSHYTTHVGDLDGVGCLSMWTDNSKDPLFDFAFCLHDDDSKSQCSRSMV